MTEGKQYQLFSNTLVPLRYLEEKPESEAPEIPPSLRSVLLRSSAPPRRTPIGVILSLSNFWGLAPKARGLPSGISSGLRSE